MRAISKSVTARQVALMRQVALIREYILFMKFFVKENSVCGHTYDYS